LRRGVADGEPDWDEGLDEDHIARGHGLQELPVARPLAADGCDIGVDVLGEHAGRQKGAATWQSRSTLVSALA
jgi:hypothetical protein